MTDEEWAAKRQEALRHLRHLRENLDQRRDASRFGSNVLLELSYRDRLHEALALMRLAGYDTAGMGIHDRFIYRKSKQRGRDYDGVPWSVLDGAVTEALQRLGPDEPSK